MLPFILLVLTIHNASADDAFRSIHSFQCDFVGGSSHKFEPESLDDDMSSLEQRPSLFEETRGLIFDAIDYRTLRARSIAKAGSEPVTVIAGDRLVSFLQVTSTGNVVLTTILRLPRPANGKANNTYYAVRSYHLLRSIEGTEASQLAGTCRAR